LIIIQILTWLAVS